MLRWYLIHTKARAESVAELHLRRQGYGVYFPRLLQVDPVVARSTGSIVPLFPRYLFLRLSETCQSLVPVQSTKGVVGVVRFGVRCAVVPDQVVADLLAREDPMSGLHRLNRCSRLALGQRVKITEGPFSGLEGVFERQVGIERTVVLLKLLGRDVAVSVRSGFIRPCLAA